MQRRKFIIDFVKTITILGISPKVFADAACANNKKVIVIGAGIAGLAAARELQINGFEVVVLESDSQIGGRIKTDKTLGFPIDLGASWIHGATNNPITDLAINAGAKTFMTNDESLLVYDKFGKKYDDDFLDEQYILFEKAIEKVKKSESINQKFETIFYKLNPDKINNNLWKFMLSAYLEFDSGGDINQLSSKLFDNDDNFLGKDLIITNGYDQIIFYLAKGSNIKTNQEVVAINYQNQKIKINTQNSVFTADYVLITVPLGVLKNNKIVFEPQLPVNKIAAIDNLGMGNVNKFVLLWDNCFWENNLQYIGYTPEMKGKFNYFMNMNTFLPNSNALMTFAFGGFANVSENLSENEVISEIMNHLKSIYGNKIPNPSKLLRTKWGQNLNSFGAYSFASDKSNGSEFDEFAKPVNNKLFFAGEHTSTQYRGTVHGAYLSGIREANKIIIS